MDFKQFIRGGGDGDVAFKAIGGSEIAYQAAPSRKNQFPDQDTLREAFDAALDEVEATNGQMLVDAIGRKFDPPLTHDDLPEMAGARSDMLAEWDRRLAVLWLEWNSHPQRLRPLREAMERDLLRAYAGLINELRQRQLGIRQYTWRSADDAKVRAAHAVHDDQVFDWDAPPAGGHPGQERNCRCWAEPFLPGANSGADEAVPEPLRVLGTFLDESGPVLSAGAGVRPGRDWRNLWHPDYGVTVNGEMLDVQTQGELSTAFIELGAAIKDDPQAALDLFARHGDDVLTLAPAFGHSNPESFVAAATLALAGAPPEMVDQALTQTMDPVLRFVGGVASSFADTAAAIAAIPDLRLSDIQLAAQRIYEDPSVLPEAMVAPFRERLAAGDLGGALGYGLPEVVAGVAGIGRLRRRVAELPEPLAITRDMLDDRGRLTLSDAAGAIEAGHNAGLYTPRFDGWLDKGGQVHVAPDMGFIYTIDLDVLGQRQTVSVTYRDGQPDFSPFMTHPSGVTSVRIEMTGNNGTDIRRANIAAGRPEWGRDAPPGGWTWHHHKDATTMQLIPRIINQRFDHRGGAAITREQQP